MDRQITTDEQCKCVFYLQSTPDHKKDMYFIGSRVVLSSRRLDTRNQSENQKKYSERFVIKELNV
jgi:hypothetical protein